MKKLIKSSCILFLIGVSYCAQSQADKFWSQLEGKWNGEGNLFGAPAAFQMSWKKVLNDRFVQLDFKNSFNRNDRSYEMTARGMYQAVQDSVSGTWFDSRGQMLPLKGKVEDDSLVVFWGDVTTERGKTVYTLQAADSVVVQDYVMKDGSYQLFGEATYSRE